MSWSGLKSLADLIRSKLFRRCWMMRSLTLPYLMVECSTLTNWPALRNEVDSIRVELFEFNFSLFTLKFELRMVFTISEMT